MKSWHPVRRADLPSRGRECVSWPASVQAPRCFSVSARQRAEMRARFERMLICAGVLGSLGLTY